MSNASWICASASAGTGMDCTFTDGVFPPSFYATTGALHSVRTNTATDPPGIRNPRTGFDFFTSRTKWNHFRIKDAHKVAPFY